MVIRGKIAPMFSSWGSGAIFLWRIPVYSCIFSYSFQNRIVLSSKIWKWNRQKNCNNSSIFLVWGGKNLWRALCSRIWRSRAQEALNCAPYGLTIARRILKNRGTFVEWRLFYYSSWSSSFFLSLRISRLFHGIFRRLWLYRWFCFPFGRWMWPFSCGNRAPQSERPLRFCRESFVRKTSLLSSRHEILNASSTVDQALAFWRVKTILAQAGTILTR